MQHCTLYFFRNAAQTVAIYFKQLGAWADTLTKKKKMIGQVLSTCSFIQSKGLGAHFAGLMTSISVNVFLFYHGPILFTSWRYDSPVNNIMICLLEFWGFQPKHVTVFFFFFVGRSKVSEASLMKTPFVLWFLILFFSWCSSLHKNIKDYPTLVESKIAARSRWTECHLSPCASEMIFFFKLWCGSGSNFLFII